MTVARILILGGTSEGFAIARILGADARFDTISSLAGRTPAPKQPVGKIRRGGFGGVTGLNDYLTANAISIVIDATHPFAHQISRNATFAARRASIPIVHVWRDGWSRCRGDCWHEVDTIEQAADAIPSSARGIFLTTGKTSLGAFANRHDVHFLARIVAPISTDDGILRLPRNLQLICDRGPFRYDDERELLLAHEVSCIVTKNSGGEAARAKLDAARDLGLPVIMVRRPPPPDGPTVATADGALAWLERQLPHETTAEASDLSSMPDG